MDRDITPLLKEWPYEPEGNVRKIVGHDGRERVQIRVCIDTYHGILQFDCDGRPDGTQVHGRPFALNHYEDALRAHRARGKPDHEFVLTPEQAEEICQEGVMIYHRYVVLLQLGDYERVVRDTARNMRLFRFVNRYAQREQDRSRLEKWWPYIIRIHHTAQAMQALGRKDFEAALTLVREARDRINKLDEQDDEVFRHERERSLKALIELEDHIEQQRPLTPLEELEKQKRQALSREEYERAAHLRDQIRRLRAQAENP